MAYICTYFGCDSSRYLLFRARTQNSTNTTDHNILRRRAGMNSWHDVATVNECHADIMYLFSSDFILSQLSACCVSVTVTTNWVASQCTNQLTMVATYNHSSLCSHKT